MSNELKNPSVNETYGTDTPAYARVTSNREAGSQAQVGVKESFWVGGSG